MGPSRIKHPESRIVFILGLLLLSSLPAVTAFGGARHFTFLYEAPTSAPGSVELENTVTWARTNNDGARLDDVGFREELEIGVTDHFQLGLYPLDWSYHGGNHDGDDGVSYDGGAVELIYNFSNPVIDPVGISVYEEISAGRQHFESESKLIAQKNFGPLILDYNLTMEAEWSGRDLQESNGELQQALGASYELSPRVSVGIEFLHEFVFPEWRDQGRIRNVFIGPNIAVRHGRCFATLTALAQATNTGDEPDLQLRTIFGFGF
jgi:hypothetical protein